MVSLSWYIPKYPYGFASNGFHFSSYRSIHGGLVQTQGLFVAADEQNPRVVINDNIVEDTEKLCKILSNHSNSSIDDSLDNASVEVSPVLVVEVLKKLSNAGLIALSFFRWAEGQKEFKYSTESYNALIEALGKIKQFKMIWNLVNDMKRSEEGGKRELTEEEDFYFDLGFFAKR